MTRQEIIRSIEEHSKSTGLLPSTICQYALSNRRVYARLKAGGSCSFETADRLKEWLSKNVKKDAA